MKVWKPFSACFKNLEGKLGRENPKSTTWAVIFNKGGVNCIATKIVETLMMMN